MIYCTENVTVAELKRIKNHTPIYCMNFVLPAAVTVHISACLVCICEQCSCLNTWTGNPDDITEPMISVFLHVVWVCMFCFSKCEGETNRDLFITNYCHDKWKTVPRLCCLHSEGRNKATTSLADCVHGLSSSKTNHSSSLPQISKFMSPDHWMQFSFPSKKGLKQLCPQYFTLIVPCCLSE